MAAPIMPHRVVLVNCGNPWKKITGKRQKDCTQLRLARYRFIANVERQNSLDHRAHRRMTAEPGKCAGQKGCFCGLSILALRPEKHRAQQRKGRTPHPLNSLQPAGVAILLAFLMRNTANAATLPAGQSTEKLDLVTGNWQLFCFTIFSCLCFTTSASPWK
jgi:hypothetical protein